VTHSPDINRITRDDNHNICIDSSTCSARIISSGLLTFFSGSNDYNCNCLQIDNKDIKSPSHSGPLLPELSG
jgi:hypothetical protein